MTQERSVRRSPRTVRGQTRRSARVKDAPADAASLPLAGGAPRRRVARRLRRADQAAAEPPRRRDERGRLLPRRARRVPTLVPMAQAVAGTALVAGGAAVLNQVYERDTDALMRRTRLRPLPDGRVSPADARMFGIALSARRPRAARGCAPTGSSALLALATLVVYLVVYTPMKRRSSLSTLVGAVPGRAAAAHRLDRGARQRSTLGGAALFAIVFLWQIPHFMAIAWMYRDDYGKAGFPMLPVIEPDGAAGGPAGGALRGWRCCRSAWCRRSSASPGPVYFGVGARCSASRCSCSRRASRRRAPRAAARALFFGSIIYLPLLWIAMIAKLDQLSRQRRVSVIRPRSAARSTRRSTPLSGRPAADRLRADPRAADRAAPPVHDRGVRHLVAVPGLLRHLPRAGRIGAVHAAGLRPAAVLHDPVTHVTLAAAVLPLAIVTLSRGLKARYRQHRRIARWTLPIWMYVSVTGVLVYVLLYQPTWLL